VGGGGGGVGGGGGGGGGGAMLGVGNIRNDLLKFNQKKNICESLVIVAHFLLL